MIVIFMLKVRGWRKSYARHKTSFIENKLKVNNDKGVVQRP